MALDHYVPQVHLRNFYSPKLGELMYAVRKRDGKTFTPNSESVCRIEDGSTNSYLIYDRAIEEFLRTVEPKYNPVVKRIAQREIDQECVYVVSGFVAYVMSCSPAGMRIQAGPLRSIVEMSARALDAAKVLPPLPESLGSASLTELLQSGKVKVTVDPKYPQAIGIAAILSTTAMFGNFRWEVLRNGFPDSPFFTSDFPVAIEETPDLRVLNRIVPLTPTLAVRIRPDISLDRDKCDFEFGHFGYRMRKIGRKEVEVINRLLVQCAEDLVFYRDDHAWVKRFIEKNRGYRVETSTKEIPQPEGNLMWSRQRIDATSVPPVSPKSDQASRRGPV